MWRQRINACSTTTCDLFPWKKKHAITQGFTISAYCNWTQKVYMCIHHSWASASRKLTPASALRHQYFQSGNSPKKCRTALAWSGTGPLPASLVFSFRYRTDRMSDSLACWHLYTRTRTRTHTYDVQHEHGQEHGHEAWTWTCTMDMDMHHGYRDG